MSIPRVSVGLPVYNGANFIRQAIESVLAQEYADWELLISDNASTDATEHICRGYASRDERICYHRNKTNLGAAGNYNQVFQLARGEFFRWAAHDDECHPGLLRSCVEALDRARASVTMVYPLGELIDEQGRTLAAPLDRIESHDPRPHRRLARVMWSLNMCDPAFGLIKASALRRTQLIGPFFGADYVLLGELAMLGEIQEVGQVLFRLRAHPKRSVKANPGARAREAWYDPAAARRWFVMPSWERMIWEMVKSAWRAPLPWAERWRCCVAAAGVHYWRRFRNTGGRIKDQIKAGLRLETGREPKPSGQANHPS